MYIYIYITISSGSPVFQKTLVGERRLTCSKVYLTSFCNYPYNQNMRKITYGILRLCFLYSVQELFETFFSPINIFNVGHANSRSYEEG
jgi:hypothetical protein